MILYELFLKLNCGHRQLPMVAIGQQK